jgi:sulfite exporter TauE/SafE
MTAITEGFVFGLASSVHCAAMCGPLVLAAGGGGCHVVAYHGGRAASYIVAGGVLGAVGATSGAGVLREAAPWIAFLLAFGLVLAASGLDRWLGAIPGAGRLVGGAMRRARSWPSRWRTAALGGVTPLLPCGVSWVLYGTTLLSGSALAGASTMLGFACGSAPLLSVAQMQGGRLRRLLRPERARLVARWVFLTAAALLVWRGVLTMHGESCCH